MEDFDESEFALSWVESWNRHDLDGVMSHYADDIEFMSPYVEPLIGETSGCLKGKEALRRYFEKGLKAYPHLHFELLEVFAGVNSIALLYLSVSDKVANEVLWLNSQGKISKAFVLYTNSPAAQFTPELTV